MMKPMTTMQKVIAYSSLVFIFFAFALGIFTIWLYMTEF